MLLCLAMNWIYRFLGTRTEALGEKEREAGSLATFLITTLLLPASLVTPPERDIRIVNVVNPFYAAVASIPFLSSFSTSSPSTSSVTPPTDLKLKQNQSSSRKVFVLYAPSSSHDISNVFLMHYLQWRRYRKRRKGLEQFHIVAISVSPGIGTVDTVSRCFRWLLILRLTYLLFIHRYLISQPFLPVFTKSPTAAIQSILHVLFLPTPFKLLSQTTFVSTSNSNSTPTASTPNLGQPQEPIDASSLDILEEVLVSGFLYADCAVVVNLTVITPVYKQKYQTTRLNQRRVRV